MRRAAAGLATLVAAGAWAASASAAVVPACEAGARAQAAHRPAGGGRAPLVIGDSTSIIAAPVLGRLGLEADAHGCRGFAEGVRIVGARRRAGTLPRVVVLALGANGGADPAHIVAALAAAGPDRIVALVTPRVTPGATAAMRAAAARWPSRVLLVDWVRYSAPHGEWFGDDELHVGPPGADAYARFIRRALGPVSFPPVTALRVPRRAAGTKDCGRLHRGGVAVRVRVVRGSGRILCRRARDLAARPPLARIDGWRSYDWRGTRDGPWSWVVARDDRRVLVATVPL